MHYHRNAKTNENQRSAMQASKKSSRQLAEQYLVSHVTCAKWKKANNPTDGNHAPLTIHYAVPEEFWTVIKTVRQKFKLPLDDLLNALVKYVPNLNRSNCYRILRFYQLNQLSEKEKKELKKFAKYPPGFLHIDCFYLPKVNGKRLYVYLAIDRATRMIFMRVYEKKGKYEAADFLLQALNFYPYRIHHILTDNGREFTMKKQTSFGRIGTRGVIFEVICELTGIEHRQTKIRHPWTNGLAERAVRTVKEHTTKLERYQSVEAMIIDILHFQDIHNFQRHLKGLNFKTPYQATMEWYVKEPKLFLKNPNELLTIR
ncbi:MAG: DDE-type integrase/transposase/recombinase [Patescibacteria group bacterium]